MLRSTWVALVAGSWAGATGCSVDRTEEHASYVSARAVLGAAVARSGDHLCSDEPACGRALAALQAIPADSPDRPEAVRLLGVVNAARSERAAALAAAAPALPAPAAASPPPAVVPPADALAVASPAANAPPQKKVRKKNYRDDDDDEWGLNVVGAVDLGDSSSGARPSRDDAWSQPLGARPTPPPARLSCSEIQAKIDARSKSVRQQVESWARDAAQSRPSGSEGEIVHRELSELERGDGTVNEGFFDDPELRSLRDQLSGCTPP